MPQRPEPAKEEIEFVFQSFLNGMKDKEIQCAMEDDGVFATRTNPRYFQRMRRYFEAAKAVLGEGNNDLLAKKRREHEALLVSGLERLVDWLENLHLLLQSPETWGDESSRADTRDAKSVVPCMDDQRRGMGYLNHLGKLVEPPNTVALKCLLRHLRPDDTIVDGCRHVSEVVRRYIELHTKLNVGQLGYLREDKETALLLQINDAKKTFDQLYRTLESDVELRSITGGFGRGPCEVCSDWGGI